MAKDVKDLLNEKASINVIGILIIAALCGAAGVAFALGYITIGIIILLAGGFAGMVLAWVRK